jgi:adenylate cyclase
MTMNPAKILELQEWVIASALSDMDEAALLQGVCDRLVSAGMELWRAAAAIDSLHPTVEGHFFEWRRTKGKAGGREYERDNVADDKWRQSPFYQLIETRQPRLRCRRGDNYRQGEFPMVDDLFAEGVTDYLAYVIPFSDIVRTDDSDALSTSWCADRPGGFTDEQVDVLDRLLPTMALALRNRAIARSANNLVQVYLGRDAGARVLRGQIARGRTESIRAVLWYSDLAGFTRIADTAPPDQIVPLLNDYADCQVSAIHGQGGQVLKFVGDGLLAIFQAEEDAEACHRALDAADDAFRRLEQVNRTRAEKTLPVTRFYLGLHLGTVLYGNIGTDDRLDFTVVGQAVNEVSRIQALCKSLERNVILSSAFAQAATRSANRVVSLGRYALRGVRQAQELFTLDEYAPS